MYLCIRNAGIAPIQSFTVLGLSSARGKADKIGQFGSGSKHGVNLLMRNNIIPIIYLGNDKLEFSYRKEFMGDTEYSQVEYTFKGEKKDAGFALEFGALDWDNIEMAIREFISNAIDSSGSENILIEIVSSVEPVNDFTSVYIPLNDQIRSYYNNLDKYFLHFSEDKSTTSVFENRYENGRIYRKGVFVRECGKSLFSYNFGDDVKIDESRNMQDYSMFNKMGSELNKKENAEMYKTLLRKYDSEIQYTEFAISQYYLTVRPVLFQEVFGKDYMFTSSETIFDICKNKGLNVYLVKNMEGFFTNASNAEDYLSTAEKSGIKESKASTDTMRCFRKVWNKLQNANLTNDKPVPVVVEFSEPPKGPNNSVRMGFWCPNTNKIYINSDYTCNIKVMLEECAHYITRSSDGSREFQQFAFNVAAIIGFK